MSMGDVQHAEVYPDSQIPLKAVVGINSTYCLHAHQIPGTVEIYCNALRLHHSMIEGDEVGYGKSTMAMVAT